MPKYSRMTYEERIQIKTYLDEGLNQAEISRKLSRNRSTLSREIARTRGFYLPLVSQNISHNKARLRRTGQCKLAQNPTLFQYVREKLKKRWSPEQISMVLKTDYPNDSDMRISHESIYTYIYVLPRGELRKELTSYLRRKKKDRYRRLYKHEDHPEHFPEMISIKERPPEVADRSLAGHWEGDLIIGRKNESAIGTLVERKTRTVILVPLKEKDAESVRKAFKKELKTLPQQMKLSLTYDQGSEMAQHKLFTQNTKMKVYFCHPASPWERGTCENTNMLIRDFFPKGTDFSKIPKRELKRVQKLLNGRPRKTLGWLTPFEVFNQEVLNPLR